MTKQKFKIQASKNKQLEVKYTRFDKNGEPIMPRAKNGKSETTMCCHSIEIEVEEY